MSASRKNFLLCALVILLFLVPLWPAFDHAALPMDEGSLLVYPELILKGNVPYRDFETFYGPANLWVLSGAYAAFGINIFVERTVGLLYRVLILVGIFGLLQRWGTTVAFGCTVLCGLLILGLSLPAYAWIGAVMCGLLALWLLASPESDTRCFFGGVLGAVALLFRPDLAPAVLGSALPILLAMRARNRVLYFIGAAVGVLPLVALALVTGLRPIIDNLLLFPVIYSSPGRHLPIFSAEPCLICLLFAHGIAVVTNVIAGALAVYRDRSDSRARLLLALALFSIGLTHQAVQRIDLQHVLYATFVSVSILPLSIAALRSGKADQITFRRESVLAMAVVTILLQAAVPELNFLFRHELSAAFVDPTPKPVFLTQHDRPFPVGSTQAALTLGKMLDRIDQLALPGDRLFVGPGDLRRTNCNDTFIYHLMPQLQPATYFLEMNPFSANRPASRLTEDVANADWLVLNQYWDAWNEKNDSTRYGSDAPQKTVAERFQFVGRYGTFILYHRSPSPSVATVAGRAIR